MNKNNLKGFEFFRGLVAILIAIAVAFIFIFICADDPAQALSCLLIKPIISNGALNVKSILTILGRTTPTIFTGLAVSSLFFLVFIYLWQPVFMRLLLLSFQQ